jgi:hypothetical protein
MRTFSAGGAAAPPARRIWRKIFGWQRKSAGF